MKNHLEFRSLTFSGRKPATEKGTTIPNSKPAVFQTGGIGMHAPTHARSSFLRETSWKFGLISSEGWSRTLQKIRINIMRRFAISAGGAYQQESKGLGESASHWSWNRRRWWIALSILNEHANNGTEARILHVALIRYNERVSSL